MSQKTIIIWTARMSVRITENLASGILVCLAAAFFVGCNGITIPPIGPPALQPEKVIVINDTNATQAKIVCPHASDHDPNDCPFRSLSIVADGVRLTLRLTPSGQPELVSETIVLISLPEYMTRPTAIQATYQSGPSANQPVVTLAELTGDHARGVVTGMIDRIGILYSDPSCIMGDIAGLCGEFVDANIPFRIELDVTLN